MHLLMAYRRVLTATMLHDTFPDVATTFFSFKIHWFNSSLFDSGLIIKSSLPHLQIFASLREQPIDGLSLPKLNIPTLPRIISFHKAIAFYCIQFGRDNGYQRTHTVTRRQPLGLSVEKITPVMNDTPEPEISGLEAVNSSPMVITRSPYIRILSPSYCYRTINTTAPMLVTLPSEIHLIFFNLLNRVSSTCLYLYNTQLLCYTLGLRCRKFLGAWYSFKCEAGGEKLGSSELIQLW